jgi:hypothetical protein
MILEAWKMKSPVVLAIRMTEAERTAAAIAARRSGSTMQKFVRSLLSENQLFRRELARVKREAISEERELVGV